MLSRKETSIPLQIFCSQGRTIEYNVLEIIKLDNNVDETKMETCPRSSYGAVRREPIWNAFQRHAPQNSVNLMAFQSH